MDTKIKNQLKVWRRATGALMPKRSYAGDLGYDLFSSEDVDIDAGGQMPVPTGISVEFPRGWGGFIKDRSSLAVKQIYTSAGVIDNGYRGEIKVVIRNASQESIMIRQGEKIAQLVPIPVTEWELVETDGKELGDSERSEGGFGSSGK